MIIDAKARISERNKAINERLEELEKRIEANEIFINELLKKQNKKAVKNEQPS